jgi:UTP--glucose-1-phosphate uridylyltransferase
MNERKIRKAVIPIAGWGTRMFPATKAIPKALFPVIDIDGFCKPIIQIIIEEALSALGEAGQVCIVVQKGQREPIEAYFKEDANEVYLKKAELRQQANRLKFIAQRISFVLQEKQEGFGHAILCAKEFVGNEPFFVFLGDHVYLSHHSEKKTCAQQLLDVFREYGQSVTSLETCLESELSVNGIVTGDLITNVQNITLYKLTDTSEKPSIEHARRYLRCRGTNEGEYLCYFGIDLLTPKIFECLQFNYVNNIRTNGEIQLRDAMKTVMRSEGMLGLKMQGKRYDTGMPHPYAETVYAFHQRSSRSSIE